MLRASVIDRIRESVEAELGPRSTNLAAAMNACDSEFAVRGAFNSSMRIQRRGLVACQELTVRAEMIWGPEMIWGLMQRCRPLFGELDDALVDGLSQQIRRHITAQATAVLLLSGVTSTEPSRRTALIEQPIMECRDQLIRRFCNQATFFVEELKQPPAASAAGGVYNFQGNVGAVLTGPYATAHVHIDGAGAARLVEALEQLRDALPKAADMAFEAREQSTGLVSDIIVAARVDKPNGLTLTSLLMGLGMAVQTVASLRPAWDAVLLAAKSIGIPLP
jgi:hypothetical protein